MWILSNQRGSLCFLEVGPQSNLDSVRREAGQPSSGNGLHFQSVFSAGCDDSGEWTGLEARMLSGLVLLLAEMLRQVFEIFHSRDSNPTRVSLDFCTTPTKSLAQHVGFPPIYQTTVYVFS